MTRARGSRARPVALGDDRGSTIPLILGFFLVALYFVAGGVCASDAFTRQQNLQSICDGTAIAAANSADPATLHGSGTTTGSNTNRTTLPLADVDGAITRYLSNDPGRTDVQAQATLNKDGGTVQVRCAQHTHIAFGAMFFLGGGIDQSTTAAARSPTHAAR